MQDFNSLTSCYSSSADRFEINIAKNLKDKFSNVVALLKKDACADPENFVRGGPTLTTFFFWVCF